MQASLLGLSLQPSGVIRAGWLGPGGAACRVGAVTIHALNAGALFGIVAVADHIGFPFGSAS